MKQHGNGNHGFTSKQRQWILKRDNFCCQYPDIRVPCKGGLQVDHIIPKRWALFHHLDPDTQINIPENGITECYTHHIGHAHFCRHPDTFRATRSFLLQKNIHAYEEMNRDRDILLQHGMTYWNTEWDTELQHRARASTIRLERLKTTDPYPYTPPTSTHYIFFFLYLILIYLQENKEGI